MRKKIIHFALSTLLLALSISAQAQQPKKVPRIGYLASGDPTSESARSIGIQLALYERGYIEGQNIATEYRFAEGKIDQRHELAAELVRLRVDVILVGGGEELEPGRYECDQNDSHRYDGYRFRSCRDWTDCQPRPSRWQPHRGYEPHERTWRKATGASQRGGLQNCSRGSSLQPGQSGFGSRDKRGSPSGCAAR